MDEYREAARWYRTYLESFPDDPESFGTNYLLSETLYESERLPGRRRGIHQDRLQLPAQSAFGRRRLCRARLVRQVRRETAGRRQGRGAQAGRRCRRQVRHQLPRASRQRGRADARRRRHLRDAGPAALDRGREPGARAPAAGRSAEAPHRLHHHRPGELRPAAVRRGGEGLHRGARPAAAQRQDARRSHRAHRLGRVSPGRGQAEGRRQPRRGRRLPAHLAGRGHVEDRRAGRIRRRRAAHHPQGMAARHPGARAFPRQQPEERIHRRRHARSSRSPTARPGRRGRPRWNSSASR